MKKFVREKLRQRIKLKLAIRNQGKSQKEIEEIRK